MSPLTDLDKVRQKIDGIDDTILNLLKARGELALHIKGLKQGGSTYRPERESEILHRLLNTNQGPLPEQAIESIYRQIISACRNLQKKITVAYLGPEGTYSHEATLKMFGVTADLVPHMSLPEAVRSAEKGTTDVVLLPIENSTEGAVIETHRLLLKSDLKVCAELIIPINHCLLTKARKLSDIKVIHAHPQALGQCREWLQLHVPGAELINEASNGQAALNVKKKSKHAAIAGPQASAIFDVPVLVSGISDSANNYTRFIVLRQSAALPTGNDKTSMICSVRDKVGALHELLSILAKHHVNLVRLESQPHADHEYVFYIDIEGHQAMPAIGKALDELSKAAKTCKILGSYPKGQYASF
ncbi:MAG TPA: prephenate dehydratase [Candidatus Limnocylindrales bacterium]|nr:prephenate dehydratase [Candidatus Limnocylindrales bacterium]